MKSFSELIDKLLLTSSRNRKIDILCDYFEESSENIEKTLDIMGKDVVYSIVSKYGVDEKQLKKIWSKK